MRDAYDRPRGSPIASTSRLIAESADGKDSFVTLSVLSGNATWLLKQPGGCNRHGTVAPVTVSACASSLVLVCAQRASQPIPRQRVQWMVISVAQIFIRIAASRQGEPDER